MKLPNMGKILPLLGIELSMGGNNGMLGKETIISHPLPFDMLRVARDTENPESN